MSRPILRKTIFPQRYSKARKHTNVAGAPPSCGPGMYGARVQNSHYHLAAALHQYGAGPSCSAILLANSLNARLKPPLHKKGEGGGRVAHPGVRSPSPPSFSTFFQANKNTMIQNCPQIRTLSINQPQHSTTPSMHVERACETK